MKKYMLLLVGVVLAAGCGGGGWGDDGWDDEPSATVLIQSTNAAGNVYVYAVSAASVAIMDHGTEGAISQSLRRGVDGEIPTLPQVSFANEEFDLNLEGFPGASGQLHVNSVFTQATDWRGRPLNSGHFSVTVNYHNLAITDLRSGITARPSQEIPFRFTMEVAWTLYPDGDWYIQMNPVLPDQNFSSVQLSNGWTAFFNDEMRLVRSEVYEFRTDKANADMEIIRKFIGQTYYADLPEDEYWSYWVELEVEQSVPQAIVTADVDGTPFGPYTEDRAEEALGIQILRLEDLYHP